MCFFVTIGVPAKHAGRMKETLGGDFDLCLAANPALLAAFPRGYTLRHVTLGMCSCSLYERPRPVEEREPRKRGKQAGRGGGDARTTRATPSKAGKRETWSGLRDDLIRGLEALCQAAGGVALLVHWYRGDIERERLHLARGERCTPVDLPARAAALPEDEVLHVVVRPR
jgi:hypothetical protein